MHLEQTLQFFLQHARKCKQLGNFQTAFTLKCHIALAFVFFPYQFTYLQHHTYTYFVAPCIYICCSPNTYIYILQHLTYLYIVAPYIYILQHQTYIYILQHHTYTFCSTIHLYFVAPNIYILQHHTFTFRSTIHTLFVAPYIYILQDSFLLPHTYIFCSTIYIHFVAPYILGFLIGIPFKFKKTNFSHITNQIKVSRVQL